MMDKTTWNNILSGFQQPSILQTWEWGELKARYGWKKDFLVWHDGDDKVFAAAMILVREQQIKPFGASRKMIYVPHGPLFDHKNPHILPEVLNTLTEYADRSNVVYIKIDPQVITSKGLADENNSVSNSESVGTIKELRQHKWVKSNQEIQFKNTFLIDLSPSEEELLQNMKQKTRYNIRLAIRKGVTIRSVNIDELNILYKMYLETSSRDGFIIRPEAYYMNLWKNFIEAGLASPFLAEVDGEPVAGLVLFHFYKKSYYFYGMSLDKHREKMPNYLLQWEAIKHSKRIGCLTYDLWGAPNEFIPEDRMWGVYRFKQGLGGEVVQTIGAFDFPSRKIEYRILRGVLPRIQSITRMLRRKEIIKEIDQ